MNERWMRPAVMEWCKSSGHTPCCEVCTNHGSTDIIAIEFFPRVGRRIPEMKSLIAVELKLKDIADVLHQTIANHGYCHRSYAAMPEATIHRMRSVSFDKFSTAGVGLLAVSDDNEVRVVVESTLSDRPMKNCYRGARLPLVLWRRIVSGRTHWTPEETAERAREVKAWKEMDRQYV